MNTIPVIPADALAIGYPLVYATVSGGHLYGFDSDDSDVDIRAVHVVPSEIMLGLFPRDMTLERLRYDERPPLDVVSHDIRDYLLMLLKANGNALEQIFSPLVLHTSQAHHELKAIAAQCITRPHANHYLGFSRQQWKLFTRARTAKSALYAFRTLYTGQHMMRTGNVDANLYSLMNRRSALYGKQSTGETAALLDHLIAIKREGGEWAVVPPTLFTDDVPGPYITKLYEAEVRRLEGMRDESLLPERIKVHAEMNDLLLRLRAKAVV